MSDKLDVSKAPPFDAPEDKHDVSRAPPFDAPEFDALDKVRHIGPAAVAETISKKMDPYTGAPIRAGVGSAMGMTKESNPLKAWLSQQVAGKVLPDTPSGEKLTEKGMTNAGVSPEFAKSTAKTVGPMVGGMMDYTALPIGPEVAYPAAKGVAKVGSAAMHYGMKPLEELGNLAAKGTYGVGNLLTGGRLPVEKSMKAIENISAAQQLLPELFLSKAGNKIGNIREANAINPAIVPGSGQEVSKIPPMLDNAKSKVLSAPMVGAMSDKVSGMAGKDLTVPQIDQLIQNLNEMHYTPLGSSKAVKPQIASETNASRAILSGELNKDPSGVALQNAKDTYSGLKTAQGPGASKLRNMGSMMFAPMTHGASLAFSPRTYHAGIAAARLPKAGLNLGLGIADKAGSIIDKGASISPKLAEYLTRSMLLSPGRDDEETP